MMAWLPDYAFGWELWVLALLHSLWQAPLVALVVAAMLTLLPARRPEARYLLCCAGLVVSVLLLGGTMAILQERPLPESGRLAPAMTDATSASPAPQWREAREISPIHPIESGGGLHPLPWVSILGWAWLAGALTMLYQTAARLGQLRRAVRATVPPDDSRLYAIAREMADRLGIGRQVLLRTGEEVTAPQSLGIWRPVILLPAATLKLPVEMLEAAILHELAHIRRHDYFVNLMQRVVECMLFFNPAVWWLSRQIRIERESCCDALAATVLGDVARYAQGLADWYAISTGAPIPYAPALGGSAGGSMAERLRRLLVPGYRPAFARISTASVGLLLPVTGMVVLLLGTGYGATVFAARALSDRERVEEVEAVAAAYANDPVQESWWLAPGDTLEKTTIGGWVRTFDHSPLPKGTVVKAGIERQSLFASYSICHSQQIEVRGRRDFTQTLEPGRIYLSATAPGFAPTIVGPILAEPGSTTKDLELVLEPGFAATVALRDTSGAPIVGAEIEAKYDVPTSIHATRLLTDEAGQATISHAGSFPMTLEARAPGFEGDWITWTPTPDELLDWTLAPTTPLQITVIREGTREPISNATLHEIQRNGGPRAIRYDFNSDYIPGPVFRTDAAGRCTLASLRDDTRYTYRVDGPDGGRAFLSDVHVSAGELVVALPELIVLAGTVTGALERLRDEYGNHHLWLYRIEDNMHGSIEEVPLHVEGNVGHFRVEKLWKGRFVIKGGGFEEVYTLTEAREDVQIEIPPTNDEPVSETSREVIVQFSNVGDTPPGGTLEAIYRINPDHEYLSPTLVKIQDGEARFTALTPNTLRLTPKGMTGYWFSGGIIPRDIEVPVGDEPFIVTVDLSPAGAIYGTLHEANGEPAESVMVSLVVEEKPEALQEHRVELEIKNTIPGGGDRIDRFSAYPLPLGGVYRIVARRGNTYVTSEAIRLTDRAPTVAIAMTMPEVKRFEGEVIGPDGQPVRSAEILLEFRVPGGHTFKSRAQLTNSDGRFVFTDVNPDADGQYSLSIVPREGMRAVYLQEIDIHQSPQRFYLEKGAALSGRVIDQDSGEPVPHTTVTAHAHHSSRGVYPPVESITDENGDFQFTTLAPVRYFFHVEKASVKDPFSESSIATAGQEELFEVRVKRFRW